MSYRYDSTSASYRQIQLATGVLLAAVVMGCGTSQDEPPPINTHTPIRPTDDVASATRLPKLEPQECCARKIFVADPIQPNSIVIGLDADMTSGSAASGEAIRRGIAVAMEEINSKGGVLGRPLELVIRDHRGNPARGIDNIHEFAEMERLVAVVGGIHTPVALSELDAIHDHEIVYLGPWAAGTGIVANDRYPNFVFRISVRDEFAGGFLVEQATHSGLRKLALLLEQTPWGRSNEIAIRTALAKHGSEPTTVRWFHWGVEDLTEVVKSITETDADGVILVCNVLEGVAAARAMAQQPAEKRLPIVSHWGITAGEFFAQAKDDLPLIDLRFLQTYSFLNPTNPGRADAFVAKYADLFNVERNPTRIHSPVGTAHAYDLVHILALAIKNGQSLERTVIRDALENISDYEGLIRTYRPPFTAQRHDALNMGDFCLARFGSDGEIIPITP